MSVFDRNLIWKELLQAAVLGYPFTWTCDGGFCCETTNLMIVWEVRWTRAIRSQFGAAMFPIEMKRTKRNDVILRNMLTSWILDINMNLEVRDDEIVHKTYWEIYCLELLSEKRSFFDQTGLGARGIEPNVSVRSLSLRERDTQPVVGVSVL